MAGVNNIVVRHECKTNCA